MIVESNVEKNRTIFRQGRLWSTGICGFHVHNVRVESSFVTHDLVFVPRIVSVCVCIPRSLSCHPACFDTPLNSISEPRLMCTQKDAIPQLQRACIRVCACVSISLSLSLSLSLSSVSECCFPHSAITTKHEQKQKVEHKRDNDFVRLSSHN